MTYKQILSLMTRGLVILGLFLIYFRGSFLPIFPEQIKVGATYMTMNNDFYRTLNQELKRGLGRDGDLLYTRDPELDEDKQSQQIEQFIREQVQVLVINPVKSDSPQILKALQKAKQEGIKIIAVDTALADKELADTTIVSDNYQAGVLIAKKLMKQKSSADILLLEHKNTVSAMDRIQGFLDTLSPHSAYRVISRRDTLGQTEESMSQVRQILGQGIHFDTIMALNDRTALGALAAIKNQPLPEKVFIYGVDGSPEMKSLLATTTDIEGTVAQSPLSMGKKVLEVIKQMELDKPYQSNYQIPVTLLDKSNIQDYSLGGWQ